MHKILKLNDNKSYELIDNNGIMCKNCCFYGNLGNCWLICNDYKCFDRKKYIYKPL